MSIIHRYLSVKNKEKVLNYIVEEFGTDGFRDLLQTVVFSEYYTNSNLTICEKELLFEEYIIETIWDALHTNIDKDFFKNLKRNKQKERIYKDRSKYIFGSKKSKAVDDFIDSAKGATDTIKDTFQQNEKTIKNTMDTISRATDTIGDAIDKSRPKVDDFLDSAGDVTKKASGTIDRFNKKVDDINNKIDRIISSPITKGATASFVVLIILFVVYKIYNRIYYSACGGMHGYELKLCKIKSIKAIIRMLHDKKKHCKLADDSRKCIEKIDKAIGKFRLKLFKLS